MSKAIVQSLMKVSACRLYFGCCQQTRRKLCFVEVGFCSGVRFAHTTIPVNSDALPENLGESKLSSKEYLSRTAQHHDSASGLEKSPTASVIPNIPSQKIHFYRRALPRSCISFTSEEGKEIFRESLLAGDMNCYFHLASQYRTQDEPAFCGLSTLVMVLNTLEVDPKKVWKSPWRWYHENMLDCCIPLAVVEKTGITMDQFACLAACNMLNVKMMRTDQSVSVEDFRNLVKNVVRRTDQVLVVTYSRGCLEQTGDGHFSPIGGYNAQRDLVLIMDTARFKYPPHWVSLSMLFNAMQELDKAAGLPRGYFLLSKSNISPGLIFRLSVNLSPVYLQNKDSKIAAFFQSWEQHLMTQNVTQVASSPLAVFNLAISRLLLLLDDLDSDVFLLTAEIGSEEMSRHYGRDIRKLLLLIEGMPIYQIIDQGIKMGNISINSLRKAGISGRSSSGVEHPASSIDQPCSRLNLNVASYVTSAHFLAMLILSWPYHHCNGGRLCTALHSHTSMLLAESGSELLQNEVFRLRQQLTSILSYCKSCSDDSCKQLSNAD